MNKTTANLFATPVWYKKVQNKMTRTAEKAPFLGMVIPNEKKEYDPIVQELIDAGCVETPQAIDLVMSSFARLAQEQVGLYGRKLQTPFGFFGPKITGSMETQDAEVGSDNELIMAVTPSPAFRAELSDIVPKEKTAERAKIPTPSIDSTLAEGASEYNVLEAGKSFCIAGMNLDLAHRDSDVLRVVNRKTGTEYPVTEYTPDSIFRIDATLPGNVPTGDYTLEVGTNHGDEAMPPVFGRRVVKVIGSATPPPTPPTVDNIASDGKTNEIAKGEKFYADGANLSFDRAGGDTVKVKWTEGGEEKEAQIEPTGTVPERMSFDFPDTLLGVPDNTELTFEFALGGATLEKSAELIGG